MLGVLCFAALVSRSPSVVLRPQFWAEDGQLFYQQAHALGFLHTLIIPYGGYLHTLPRLTAGLSLLLPLSLAPLLFNLVALLTESLPPIYLFSGRMQNIGPLPVRVLLAFLYVGVPNVARVHGNLTNAQWHLAVLCCLILLAPPPKSVWAATFDVAALAIGAFTGPFAIFLLPVALVVAWRRRDRWAIRRAGILCLGVIVMPFTMFLSTRPQSPAGLGASLAAFCRIVAFQVFVPVFRGVNNSSEFAQHPALLAFLSYAITAVGLALLTYVFLRGNMEVRCFLLFAAMVLATSLARPLASPTEPQWLALQRQGSTHRYWLIPELAVAAAFVWLASTAANRMARATGAALVCVMLIVDVVYWRLPELPDLHFASYVATFKALPVGHISRFRESCRLVARTHQNTARLSSPVGTVGYQQRVSAFPHPKFVYSGLIQGGLAAGAARPQATAANPLSLRGEPREKNCFRTPDDVISVRFCCGRGHVPNRQSREVGELHLSAEEEQSWTVGCLFHPDRRNQHVSGRPQEGNQAEDAARRHGSARSEGKQSDGHQRARTQRAISGRRTGTRAGAVGSFQPWAPAFCPFGPTVTEYIPGNDCE